MACSVIFRRSSHVEVETTKKGLKSPCFRAPPHSWVGSSTPGDAPTYENRNHRMLHDPYLLPRFLLLHCCALHGCSAVISIVAIAVKANAATIRRGPTLDASNARLKSKRRRIPMG
jgi:hypothetical protein